VRWSWIAILCLFFFSNLSSQTLVGKVYNAADSSEIPFAQIVSLPSQNGTITNFDGSFVLNYDEIDDSISVFFAGFEDKRLSLKSLKSPVKIYISEQSTSLEEVEIFVEKRVKRRKRKEDPAYILHQKIVGHKSASNYQNYGYQTEIYNKVQVDLNNVTENTKKQLIFRPISFVFDHIDSTREKPAVSIFLSEAVSDYYYQPQPDKEREVIKGTRMSGVELATLNQFTGNAYLNFNIYDDYYNILQKSFISPLAELSWLSYKYFLTDSTTSNDTAYYRLDFVPRRKADLAFSGHVWVNNKDFAVKEIELNVDPMVNINFLNAIQFTTTFELKNGIWLPKKETIDMDVYLVDNTWGFYIYKNTSYKNYMLQEFIPDSISSNPEKVVQMPDIKEQGKARLESSRHVPLSEKETAIYQITDSVVNTKYAQRIAKLSEMYYTGYYPNKYFEWGPYYTFYSYNILEGSRFKLGGTTTPDLLPKTQFQGFYAYGNFDQVSKYQLRVRQFWNTKLWRFVEFEHLNNYEIIGASDNAFQEDNILASLSRRVEPRYTHLKQWRARLFYAWRNGINNYIEINHTNFHPIGSIQYYTPDNIKVPDIYSNTLTIGGRIAPQEKFIYYGFRRFSLSTKLPQFDYEYNKGFIIENKGYDFHRFKLTMSDRYYLGYLGFIDIVAEGGKIWGEVPYPMLLQHQGNDSYVFDNRAFNLMYPFEFASDQYVSLQATHHFNGLFFNQIPLVKRLHLRSLIFARGVLGEITQNHESLIKFPEGMSGLDEPYLEVGVGIENIFKIVRFDVLWRLTKTKEEQDFIGFNIGFIPSL
jgi:hypothetical protein